MPIRPCPVCEHPTPRAIDEMSATFAMNYYRCKECGSVWNVPKADRLSAPRMVTVGGIRRPSSKLSE